MGLATGAGLTALILAAAGEAPPPRLHLDRDSPQARYLAVEAVNQRIVSESQVWVGRVQRDDLATRPVLTKVAGRALRVLVSAGNRVRRGQALLELASPEVEAARSAAIQALSDVDAAQRRLEQIQFNATSVSSHDVDSARADLKHAQGEVESTRRTLVGLGVEPRGFTSLYTVRAPADGMLLEVLVQSGSEVKAGQRVARLGDPHHWVIGFATRSRSSALAPNTQVDIRLEGRTDALKGKVREIEPPGDAGAPNGVATVDDPAGELTAGAEVQVEVRRLATSQIISIPISALAFDERGVVVVVASGAWDLELRRVEIGPIDGPTVRVMTGLQADERVLVRGVPFIQAALEGR